MAPVKVVLKSTTTKTLNDRFTEMSRQKSPTKQNQQTREENRVNQRASAKNRRLAEQMSRRPGIGSTAAMDKEVAKGNNKNNTNIKNRIDRSKLQRASVKDRLGSNSGGATGGGSIQNRLGAKRGGRGGRGDATTTTTRGRGNRRGVLSRIGGGRAGKVTNTGNNNRNQNGNNVRGARRGARGGTVAGRGRGRGRGAGRGRGGRKVPNQDRLNSEIDSYMSSAN